MRRVLLACVPAAVLVAVWAWGSGGASEEENGLIHTAVGFARQPPAGARSQPAPRVPAPGAAAVAAAAGAAVAAAAGAAARRAGVGDGEEAVRDWAAEEQGLLRDLAFLRRSEASDQRLAALNAPARAKASLAHKNGERDGVHLFFTMDCTQHSLWQAMALEHSWAAVRHPGAMSRLVSGCVRRNGQDHPLLKLMQRSVIDHSRFYIFFGPQVDENAVPGPKGTIYQSYPPINRPATVYYWMSHGRPREAVLGLLDPDMVFLRPLAYPPVTRGRPAGQYYDYLVSEDWDRVYPQICADPECEPLANKRDFCPGPPHLMHRLDWADLAQWWLRYTVAARQQWGKWVAEMAGMSIGMARLQLRSKLIVDGMWDRSLQAIPALNRLQLGRGGRQLVERPKPSWEPRGMSPLPTALVPSLLHYCFTPELGRRNVPESVWKSAHQQQLWEEKHKQPLLHYMHWSKYRSPTDWPGGHNHPRGGTLLECTQGLLFEFPPLTAMLRYAAQSDDERGWAVFFAGLFPPINAALTEYKRRYCPLGSRNLRRNVRTGHPAPWFSDWELVVVNESDAAAVEADTGRHGFVFRSSSGEYLRGWQWNVGGRGR